VLCAKLGRHGAKTQVAATCSEGNALGLPKRSAGAPLLTENDSMAGVTTALVQITTADDRGVPDAGGASLPLFQ
jgi:hypothetical protein